MVISGRATLQARQPLQTFIEATEALHLETGESRGALPADHPATVPAMRARAIAEADLVTTIDRRLDFQLAYGSPAVFAPEAAFLRIGRTNDVCADNRRGDVELHADVRAALTALTAQPLQSPELDQNWLAGMRTGNAERVTRLQQRMPTHPAGPDQGMHPYQLISAANEALSDDGIAIADGGDILSFARVGLTPARYLDSGPLGCLGVGVPFATAAALTYPNRPVLALIGDGAFGFTSCWKKHT